jgi:hypothetical protein
VNLYDFHGKPRASGVTNVANDGVTPSSIQTLELSVDTQTTKYGNSSPD